MEWQLIDTAPTDGTWVIGLTERKGVVKMRIGLHYFPCWMTGEVYQDMSATPVTVKPTHWIPLPAIPV